MYCKLNKIPDIEIRVWNFLDTIKHLFYDIGFEYTLYEAPFKNVEWQKHIERAINTWFYINKIPTKLHVFDPRRKIKYLPINTELTEYRRYHKYKNDTKTFIFKHLADHDNTDLVQYFQEYQSVNEVKNTDMIDAIFNAYIFINEK